MIPINAAAFLLRDHGGQRDPAWHIAKACPIPKRVGPSGPADPRDEDGRLPHESEFLRQLGSRVREMRALHGMSRRELARRPAFPSAIVAQIEAGKGNVSIVRLLRIALVFRCEGPAA